LKDALSHNHCGYIHDNYPAPNVMPAQREVMVGHKQVKWPFSSAVIMQNYISCHAEAAAAAAATKSPQCECFFLQL
jgi:hypothetical protein